MNEKETSAVYASGDNGDFVISPFSIGMDRDNQKRSPISTTLIVIYLVLVLVSGYWYWSRPIRADQFNNAYTWWLGVAEVYNVPVPSDETWQ